MSESALGESVTADGRPGKRYREGRAERIAAWRSAHAAELDRQRMNSATIRERRRAGALPPKVQRQFVATTLVDILDRLDRVERWLWAQRGRALPLQFSPRQSAANKRLFEEGLRLTREETRVARDEAKVTAEWQTVVLNRLTTVEGLLDRQAVRGRGRGLR